MKKLCFCLILSLVFVVIGCGGKKTENKPAIQIVSQTMKRFPLITMQLMMTPQQMKIPQLILTKRPMKIFRQTTNLQMMRTKLAIPTKRLMMTNLCAILKTESLLSGSQTK